MNNTDPETAAMKLAIIKRHIETTSVPLYKDSNKGPRLVESTLFKIGPEGEITSQHVGEKDHFEEIKAFVTLPRAPYVERVAQPGPHGESYEIYCNEEGRIYNMAPNIIADLLTKRINGLVWGFCGPVAVLVSGQHSEIA